MNYEQAGRRLLTALSKRTDRLHRRFNTTFMMPAFRAMFARAPADRLARLGTKYGGWNVPVDRIESDWVCYCAGVGEDASFDLELIASFSCEVHGFDPTPRAIRYAAQLDEARYKFHPYGLWSRDETLRFYAPEKSEHVSHSVLNLQRTSTFFEADCRSLPSIMRDLGHERIDLLKMDIEGAEYEVLSSMLQAGIRPKVLCVEFDQPVLFVRTLSCLRALARAGFVLVCQDGSNFTFFSREFCGAGRARA